jgi:hypothetical protein
VPIDPHKVRCACPNRECPAKGQVGEGHIGTLRDSQKEQRYRRRVCGKTFAARTGTAFYRLRTAEETVTLVVTSRSVAHGCPLPATLAPFGKLRAGSAAPSPAHPTTGQRPAPDRPPVSHGGGLREGAAGSAGVITPAGNNLQYNALSCGASVLRANPLLGPLQDNGGPRIGVFGDGLPTLQSLPGSPAINAGDVTLCLPIDERGFLRLPPCDIGALEHDIALLLPVVEK